MQESCPDHMIGETDRGERERKEKDSGEWSKLCQIQRFHMPLKAGARSLGLTQTESRRVSQV